MADIKQDNMRSERSIIDRTKRVIGKYGAPVGIAAAALFGGVKQADATVKGVEPVSPHKIDNVLIPILSPERQESTIISTAVLPEIPLTQYEVNALNAISNGASEISPTATATLDPQTGTWDITGLPTAEENSQLYNFLYNDRNVRLAGTNNQEWSAGINNASDVVKVFGQTTVGILDEGNNNIAMYFQPQGDVQLNLTGRDLSTATALAPQSLFLDERSVVIINGEFLSYVKPQENENVATIASDQVFMGFLSTKGYNNINVPSGSDVLATISRETGKVTNIITTGGNIPIEDVDGFIPAIKHIFGPENGSPLVDFDALTQEQMVQQSEQAIRLQKDNQPVSYSTIEYSDNQNNTSNFRLFGYSYSQPFLENIQVTTVDGKTEQLNVWILPYVIRAQSGQFIPLKVILGAEGGIVGENVWEHHLITVSEEYHNVPVESLANLQPFVQHQITIQTLSPRVGNGAEIYSTSLESLKDNPELYRQVFNRFSILNTFQGQTYQFLNQLRNGSASQVPEYLGLGSIVGINSD